MKVIVLTESQVERLIDEQMLSFMNFGGMTTTLLKMDPHTRLELLAYAASEIPEVGDALAAGIGTYDAHLYWREGKKKEAAITLFLTYLPMVSKAPIFKQMGTKALAQLAEKIIANRQLTQLEMQAMNTIKSSPKILELAKGYVKDKVAEKAANVAYDAAGRLIKKTTSSSASNTNMVAARAISNAPNANKIAARAVSNAPKGLSNAPKVAYNNPNLIGKGTKV